MSKFLVAAFFALTVSNSWASLESLRSVGIEASGKDGCHLSDGKRVLGPTIGLMVDAYDDHPKLPNETIQAVIQAAIDAGCNFNQKNAVGLSPLNSAILLNHPKLVQLLLSNGANPNLKIESSKKFIDGKDSFALYEFLKTRKEMSSYIGEALAGYR
ncbi:ankyrin repeat domain-containing protein [Marinobacter hydrocarbonoclasticus]|uniref:ankyrin repeat domain-containing protein n=1 Tax=Marinobacter nauticus TaxID=2743 RepID=UPI001C96D61E|nr:ankyrin repeat domain-containing protein [Marinobacter nauticus]MBY6194571.1 ankyrin repeat domain-containing protein [Marinobacter nauticus]MBY6215719.1 ankyrin repeat domain-containing protein [Marinobacter nauticus]